MGKKKRHDSDRRRELLRRLDDVLAESVDTRRRLVNRLHHAEERVDPLEGGETAGDAESSAEA